MDFRKTEFFCTHTQKYHSNLDVVLWYLSIFIVNNNMSGVMQKVTFKYLLLQKVKVWIQPADYKFWLAMLNHFENSVAGTSLTNITVLCPWARHIHPCLVLVQPRKTRTDNKWKNVEWDEKNQINQSVNENSVDPNQPASVKPADLDPHSFPLLLSLFIHDNKGDPAMLWEKLFSLYPNNNDADQPAHTCSLISIFVICCMEVFKKIQAKSKFLRF